jgi:RsiW-degrading membrane proteinase PrsW (M82 family)
VGIIVLITGLISKSEAVKRTSYLIFIIAALSSIVAMNTGESAEDIVEKISGVSENYIETHEESAETLAILSYVLGGFSLLGLWASFKKKSVNSILSIITLIFAFVVVYFGSETGTTGGEIQHTEIRSDSSTSSPENGTYLEEDDD